MMLKEILEREGNSKYGELIRYLIASYKVYRGVLNEDRITGKYDLAEKEVYVKIALYDVIRKTLIIEGVEDERIDWRVIDIDKEVDAIEELG